MLTLGHKRNLKDYSSSHLQNFNADIFGTSKFPDLNKLSFDRLEREGRYNSSQQESPNGAEKVVENMLLVCPRANEEEIKQLMLENKNDAISVWHILQEMSSLEESIKKKNEFKKIKSLDFSNKSPKMIRDEARRKIRERNTAKGLIGQTSTIFAKGNRKQRDDKHWNPGTGLEISVNNSRLDKPLTALGNRGSSGKEDKQKLELEGVIGSEERGKKAKKNNNKEVIRQENNRKIQEVTDGLLQCKDPLQVHQVMESVAKERFKDKTDILRLSAENYILKMGIVQRKKLSEQEIRNRVEADKKLEDSKIENFWLREKINQLEKQSNTQWQTHNFGGTEGF